MMPFFPRSRLRAADLNDVVDRADSAHIAGGGYLAFDNGFEQSVRNPRRGAIPAARGGTSGEPVPARVVSFSNGIYVVDFYADGLKKKSTGRGVLTLTGVSVASELPPGTVVLAFPVVANRTPVEEKAGEQEEAT